MSGFAFSSHGAGKGLIRSTTVAGRPVRFKTGHGYYRPHTGLGGRVTDLRFSGLTVDAVETAIALDIEGRLSGGGTYPAVGPGVRPAIGAVSAGGKTIEYRAIEVPGGLIDVPTYYEL